MKKILVMGVGNVLLGDEGVGVHAIEFLEKQDLPSCFDLLDGGTGGFHLLSTMFDYEDMILIDATIDQNPAGTLRVIQPKYSRDFPRALTTHDIGLKDLLDTATVLDRLPRIFLLAVTISPKQDVGLTLSPEIEAILPEISKKIMEIGEKLEKESFK